MVEAWTVLGDVGWRMERWQVGCVGTGEQWGSGTKGGDLPARDDECSVFYVHYCGCCVVVLVDNGDDDQGRKSSGSPRHSRHLGICKCTDRRHHTNQDSAYPADMREMGKKQKSNGDIQSIDAVQDTEHMSP